VNRLVAALDQSSPDSGDLFGLPAAFENNIASARWSAPATALVCGQIVDAVRAHTAVETQPLG
jgi:hypothetical protein